MVTVASRVMVTYNVAVMVRHRVRARYRDSMGGYFLQLHTPLSIVGLA